MKTLTKIFKKLINSPYVVLISLLDSIINVIQVFYKLLMGQTKLINIHMEASYFEISIRLLTVVFLFILWKSFLKTKKSAENHLNNINEHWHNQLKNTTEELTKNINDSHRILSNQIRFIHFNNEFKDLPKEEYFKKITLYGGFSKEDLIEIGVDEKLIKENDNKLFSKNVMDKFLAFKTELQKLNK